MIKLSRFLVGSSLLVMAVPALSQATIAGQSAQTPAGATPPAPVPAEAIPQAASDDIVVTGSRIVTNGFQAPTPVTTLAQEALLARAPTNIPDALNQLPQFRGSTSNNTSMTWNANSPNQGNYLNLRGLGTSRSLVLLDGVRVPPTSFQGGVDINTLPQVLVQRVDVVTGGASAAYGSDAVVGVVNFILDKNFNGVKGSMQGGISAYGDTPSYKATIAAGTSFAEGRGHIEGSFEHYYSAGIDDLADRPLGSTKTIVVGARTQANPGRTYENVRFLRQSTGGTINSGPLNGYQFLPDGSVRPVDRGQPTNDPNTYSVGGSGGYYEKTSLTARLMTDQAFGRFSYELADNVTAHVQATGARSTTRVNLRNDERFSGTSTGVTIFSDNAFLRPDVVAQLQGTPSFQLGRISLDTPKYIARTLNTSVNANAGLEGKFGLLGKNWNWDVNYVYGRSYLRTKVNEFNNRRFYAAIDAVRDANGNIVCGVTLRNPGLLQGCVPMNIFGEGAPSEEAVNWVMGESRFTAVNEMHIGSFNVSGELFDLPAGPVSIAFGGEVRRQTLDQKSNSDPAAAGDVDYTGIRGVPTGVLISNFTNIGLAKGAVNVKEAYGEVNVPILKDVPLIQSLDLNGAVRVTDYSTSGTVVTWKAGVNYSPFADLRIRSTLSRDIAAPSLYQLFAGRQLANIVATDPHTNVQSLWLQETGGNPDLKPERGTMLVVGGVYSPGWLTGFTVSVDYYHLKIKDAIANTNSGDMIRDCDASGGTAAICDFIIRPLPFDDRSPANFPTRVILVAQNQAAVLQSGIDIEGAYRFPLDSVVESWAGTLEFKTYLSRSLKSATKQNVNALYISTLGAGNNTRLRGSFEVNYMNGPLSVRFAERFTGKSRRNLREFYDNDLQEPNRWYADLNISYKLQGIGFLDTVDKELFFSGQNIFNAKPPRVPDCCNPGLQIATDRGKYDVVGGYYTVGVRFRF